MTEAVGLIRVLPGEQAVPGDVVDGFGNILLRYPRERAMACGRVWVNKAQAMIAAEHGWKIIRVKGDLVAIER